MAVVQGTGQVNLIRKCSVGITYFYQRSAGETLSPNSKLSFSVFFFILYYSLGRKIASILQSSNTYLV